MPETKSNIQKKELTAAVYTRYSSHSQRDVSIEQQLRACRLFAERQGIQVVATYEDHAMTGTSDRRPGFQQMIKDSAHAEWQYVIVYTLDRFARDRYDSAVYKRQLKNNGVKVLSAMENISDDPTGVLMESMLEGLAEYYSKELSRKIRRGMEDNAHKCMANGSLPLGYVRGSDGRYEIAPAEAALVQEIFTRVADGDPLTDIIKDMNARGARTKKGREWNKSSFNKLLSNERYIGTYIYGETRIPGGVPRIISDQLFNAVQYRLHNKPNSRAGGTPKRRRRDDSIYLLTGKLFCGSCGQPMIGISGKSQGVNPYYYYICRGKRMDHICDRPMVRREKVETTITQAIQEYALNDQTIEILADAAIEYQNRTFSNVEVDALTSRLSDIQKSIRNLVSAIEAGIFSSATQARLSDLENEERQVAGQLAIAEAEAEQRLTRNEIIAALKLYQNGEVTDKEYQESLIDTFLVKAFLHDDKVVIFFNLGDKKKEIEFPIDDLDTTNPNICIDDPRLHQMRKIRTCS